MHVDTSRSDEQAAHQAAADLVRRIGAGDPKAEEELVERFSRGLRLLLRRLTRDPHLADDLHQETFRVVLEKARRKAIREPERVAGYIRATARNLFLVDRRKAARYTELDDPSSGVGAASKTPPATQGPQLDHVLRAEESKQVRTLLDELRFDRDRQLLIRFYLSEQPPNAICTELDVDPPRFRKVMHRARQRLRELWERSEKRQQLSPGAS